MHQLCESHESVKPSAPPCPIYQSELLFCVLIGHWGSLVLVQWMSVLAKKREEKKGVQQPAYVAELYERNEAVIGDALLSVLWDGLSPLGSGGVW